MRFCFLFNGSVGVLRIVLFLNSSSSADNFIWLTPKHTHVHKYTQPAASTTARFIILSDEETDAILKSAHECAESECSVDDVSSLVFELKGQQVEMEARLKKISSMISELEHLSGKSNRNKDEVKAFVKDMMRVFSHGEVSYIFFSFSSL